MSKLILTGHGGARFKLNITQFRSPMSASINSVQTRTMQHHFPIRAGQPDMQFTAHFTSLDAKHEFQNFVRDHQRNTQKAQYASSALEGGAVTLLWPERNILNWTGYIVNMPVREPRFEYAPRVTYGVALVESALSEQTWEVSIGNGFNYVLGPQIPAYPDDSAVLQPPIPPSSQQPAPEAQGQNLIGSVFGTIADVVGRLFR
jgi:hypothetical protein